MDIVSINKIYNQYQLEFKYSGNEESIINLLLKQKEWSLLDDEQKNIRRKKYLQDFEKHFIYSEKKRVIFLYESLVFQISLKIKDLLDIIDTDTNISTFEGAFFRIKSMLFCEKELINQYESFNRIGHIPYEIFEPLIEKVKDTQEYKQYKLDNLFERYKRMYDLFLEKPYG